jgi:molybdopterin-guanine dinucleotide biosynthesis protein A
MNITGIILAGGKSSRMGMEKGLVKFKNKPLIQYAIDTLGPACGQIIISSNSNAYQYTGLRIIPDEVRGIGPVGGIHACLNASATNDNIVLSCDTPFINKALIGHLIQNHQGALAAVPWFGNDKYEPVSAYYHKDFAKVLAAFIRDKNYKLPDIFNKVKITKLRMEGLDFYYPGLFYNINSREDIERFS